MDSSCDFPGEIQGTWVGKRTTLTIGQRSYNESGSHGNGNNQVVVADCFQRRGNTFLLSAPTMVDGLLLIGYLCWSYFKVNQNVLLIYGKMANISPYSSFTNGKTPAVSDCPSSLNVFPDPPAEGAIGTYYAQKLYSVQCPFIGRHRWNYGCSSGNSTLDACNYPYDTLEDDNRCKSQQYSDYKSNIYKCIASWEGSTGVNYLLLTRENRYGAILNDHFCYAYIQHKNDVVKGTIEEFQCTTQPEETAADHRLQNAVILNKVPNMENCDVSADVPGVPSSSLLISYLSSLAILTIL
ncbi:uncharacterized protein [Ptychodera flava]|uniref:uncharacterized protein isoform X2 n=1 Tax=Ptychodera flava TaxID=63121 RepID=UPI003969BDD8